MKRTELPPGRPNQLIRGPPVYAEKCFALRGRFEAVQWLPSNESGHRPSGITSDSGDASVMTAPQTHPPRLPIPRSTARVQLMETGEHSWLHGCGKSVQVRCGTCEHRLFDVSARHVRVRNAGSTTVFWQEEAMLEIEKVCSACKRAVRGMVTARPGDPVEGLDGPWRCECGKSLAYVDSIRGRVTTRCRCGTEARVTASDAISAPKLPAASTLSSANELGVQALDDVPF
jgi:hypothetical protein